MSSFPAVLARPRRVLAALLSAVIVASGLTLLAPTPASAAVPTRPADSSQVVVKAGSQRDGNSVTGLRGVQLELRTASGNTRVASCVSDADGDCVFTVPNSALSDWRSTDFVVVPASTAFQPGSPAALGYFDNPEFVTSSSGNSFDATSYRLPVSLDSNETVTVPTGSGVDRTSGIWQNSLDNPAANAQCGLDIALVSDLSYSVRASGSLDTLKTAAAGFVDALEGTPSTISLHTFGSVAPAPNTTDLLKRSTLDPAQVDELLDTIDDYAIPSSPISYTNWDAALRQVTGKGYDQVVVITDGNPTRSGIPPEGDEGATRFVELEHAIFSANALKAQGTRIVGVGVGDSFDDGQNLRAISGPNEGSDYFISGWSDLADVLDDLARANCEGTVTVVKQVVPWDEAGLTGATPTGDWGFAAPSVTTGTVTPSTAQTTKSNPGQGDHGTINYKLGDIPHGATFSVSEVQQPGYSIVEQGSDNAVCVKNGGTPVPVSDAGDFGFSVPVGQSDIVTCTIYNKAPEPTATVTVHKQWVVNGAPEPVDSFPTGFAASATIGGTTTPWNTATQVTAGTVVVDESSATVPGPYCTLTGQHVTSFNGSAVGPVNLAGAGSYPTPTLPVGSANTVTITNAVTCTGEFVKAPGTATADVADGTWDITYTLTATNPSAVSPFVYDLVDTPKLPVGVEAVAATVTRGATTVLDAPAWTGDALDIASGARIAGGGAPDVYTVTLTVAIPSTVPADLLLCGVTGRGFDNTATLTPGVGSPITDTACVSVVPPTVSHTKSVTGVSQDPTTGDWSVVYDVTVTAKGSGVARYDLGDTLAFGAGITVTSAAVAAKAGSPAPTTGWTGTTPNTSLVSGGSISAGTSHTFTVTVVASVAKGVTNTAAADCALVAPESGTGFRNDASLTAAGSTVVVSDCARPVVPTLDKSFVSAVQNADASWDVTFSVLVDNPDAEADVAYSLGDVPGFPTGVTILDTSVTLDGTGLAWDGTAPLASDRILPAGESDTFVIVFTVSVDPGMPTALLTCDAAGAGHGFFNSATLTAGRDTVTDADCGPIAESVLPLVAKTVDPGYPHQLADGDWMVRYSVTVSTPTGTTLSTRYDLDDTLALGAGSTILSASAAGPSGAVAGWTGAAPDVALADDVLLLGGASHVYSVLVRVELPAGSVTSAAADCTLDAGETGTGFLNTVLLTSGTASRTAEACAAPALPTLDKVLDGAPVPKAGGLVDVAYTVTVSNPSGLDLVYDLDDRIGFAVGVTILDASVTGPAGITTDAAWTGSGADIRVVTAQPLPAGATHVYDVVVNAMPTLFVADADLACVAATPGHGYFNGAVLTSGAEVLTADACATIPTTDLPTLPLPPDLPTLALTGTTVGGGLLAALALLLVGAGVAFSQRRRPAHRL